MKQVEAIIHPSLVDDVKDRLTLVGVRGMTIHQLAILGFQWAPAGSQPFATRICVRIVATADMVETIVNAILTVARRTEADGRILITPVIEAIRIRTGETGADAL